METGHAVVVGAGPAGAALGFMLARRGIRVTLIERHSDFERTFRGDGLQPSGMMVFEQMGFRDEILKLPHAAIKTIEIYQKGRKRVRLKSDSLGFVANFVPQQGILRLITSASQRFANFELQMSTSVRDVVRVDGRVSGVLVEGSDGKRVINCDIVIATDGRYSTLRNKGDFAETQSPQHFDVLNFVVPMPDFWPDRGTVRLEMGTGCLTGGIPTADGRLWVGMTIDKGHFKELKAGSLTQELLDRTSPDLGTHLLANPESLRKPVLLDVRVRCPQNWSIPGLLLLGDAAHPMSPNGGQGINMALRDAVVAANHLGPILVRRGSTVELDAAATQVMTERMPEIKIIQDYQRKQSETFLRANSLKSKIGLKLLPFLASTGLLPLLVGKRLETLQHGVANIRLTF